MSRTELEQHLHHAAALLKALERAQATRGLPEAERLALGVLRERVEEAVAAMKPVFRLVEEQAEALRAPAQALFAVAERLEAQAKAKSVAGWRRELEPHVLRFVQAVLEMPR